MCEFTVYIAGDTKEERELVAKEIIICKVREGKVVLLNIAGEGIHIDGVVIKEVNTMSQELILQREGDT